jgi:hypothetical protein
MLDLDPTPGAEIQGLVENILRTPPAIVDRVRKIVDPSAR